MTRWTSSLTGRGPHWRHRLALMLLGCAHVITAGLLTQPSTALGQGERANTVTTEIWMRGGLELTRRVPQDGRSFRESNDNVARTMVEIAQQRRLEGDNETAIWLIQWARQLTNGRKGSNRFAEIRQNDVASKDGENAVAGRKASTFANALTPAPLEFHPSGPIASILEWRDEHHQPRLRQWDVGESKVVHNEIIHNHEQWSDDIGRQDAVAVADSGHIGVANQVNRDLPAELTVEPIAIACAVLLIVLLLVPLRLTIQRKATSQFRAPGAASPVDSPEAAPSVASVSSNSHAPRRVFKTAGEQDKVNSVVEDFFLHNVGLLKRLHDQAIPSVKDAEENRRRHIGAAHA